MTCSNSAILARYPRVIQSAISLFQGVGWVNEGKYSMLLSIMLSFYFAVLYLVTLSLKSLLMDNHRLGEQRKSENSEGQHKSKQYHTAV